MGRGRIPAGSCLSLLSRCLQKLTQDSNKGGIMKLYLLINDRTYETECDQVKACWKY
jgi:hypothetical protein